MFQTQIPCAVQCRGQNPFVFVPRTMCTIVYGLYRLALTPQGRTFEDVDVIKGLILVVPGIMTPKDFLLVEQICDACSVTSQTHEHRHLCVVTQAVTPLREREGYHIQKLLDLMQDQK